MAACVSRFAVSKKSMDKAKQRLHPFWRQKAVWLCLPPYCRSVGGGMGSPLGNSGSPLGIRGKGGEGELALPAESTAWYKYFCLPLTPM